MDDGKPSYMDALTIDADDSNCPPNDKACDLNGLHPILWATNLSEYPVPFRSHWRYGLVNSYPVSDRMEAYVNLHVRHVCMSLKW